MALGDISGLSYGSGHSLGDSLSACAGFPSPGTTGMGGMDVSWLGIEMRWGCAGGGCLLGPEDPSACRQGLDFLHIPGCTGATSMSSTRVGHLPRAGGQVRGRGRRWTEEDPSPQHLLQAPLLYGWQDLAPSKLELSPRDTHPSRRVFFPDVGPYRQPGTRSCRRTPCLADKVPVRRTPARCRPRCPWGKSTEQTVTHRLPYCRDTHAWHLRSQACHGDSNK